MSSLAEKARRFEDLLEERFFDSDGLLYQGIRFSTMRPWRADEIQPGWTLESRPAFDAVGWPTIDQFASYEDNPYDTGCYLAFRSYKNQVTGDKAELAKMERLLPAIEQVFAISEQVFTRGAYLKPFGGLKEAHRSRDMTPDNTWGLIHGLYHYHQVAPADIKPRLLTLLVGLIDDFNIKHRYACVAPESLQPFRGLIDYMEYPLYHAAPMFVHETRMLYELTGDERYWREYERLVNLDKPGINTRIETHVQAIDRTGAEESPYHHMGKFDRPVDAPPGSRPLLAGGGWHMVMVLLADLARWDTSRSAYYAKQARAWWEHECLPTYVGNGKVHWRIYFDLVTRKRIHCPSVYTLPALRERVDVKLPAVFPSLNLPHGAICTEELAPGLGAKAVAREILEQTDLKEMVREQPAHVPQYAWLADTLYPPVGWLEAYWHGRLLGFWD